MVAQDSAKLKKRLYRIRVYPIDVDTEEVEWVAEIPDLPGCVGAGDTPEEAVTMVRDAQEAWINAALQAGKTIPEPIDYYNPDYSGKFTLRLPKTLHRDLALQAEEEGVSLNQYILFLLSKGLYHEKALAHKEENEKIQIHINAIYTFSSWNENRISDSSSSYLKDFLQKRCQ